jgi:hypothetical protein
MVNDPVRQGNNPHDASPGKPEAASCGGGEQPEILAVPRFHAGSQPAIWLSAVPVHVLERIC